ncbi:receptor-like protein 12 [Dorcoceras hygrometricum]|uniref:Receptor-like protein 12 n=1 Tax=Dorcoceras hygrometricum TaxID=472368 RepID=A0A2Z7C2G5_9LAMI|nr:receptor-like protein 12 [Dorcoceras hygrometricum]
MSQLWAGMLGEVIGSVEAFKTALDFARYSGHSMNFVSGYRSDIVLEETRCGLACCGDTWTGPVCSPDLSGDVTSFSDSRFGVSGMTCPVGTVDFSFHGFSAGRGVDPAGNAPGDG